MSQLSKINRKLKSAMKLFIKTDDEGALRSIEKLIKNREMVLSNPEEREGRTWGEQVDASCRDTGVPFLRPVARP